MVCGGFEVVCGGLKLVVGSRPRRDGCVVVSRPDALGVWRLLCAMGV